MVGLALEGGGVRGSYQIGAFIALYDCGIKIDGFVGTSIGSFNAAMLASNKHYELLDFWENVDVAKLFDIQPLDLKEADLKDIKNSINSYLKLLKNKGIDVQNMLLTLDKVLDVDSLYASKKDFGLVTFRVKDLKPIIKYKEDIPKEKLKEYILASCYLPVFKKQKIIDDNYYFDGGIYDNSPVNMLIKKGYQKIYLVKLNSFGVTQKLTKNVDLTVIEPSRYLGSILNLDGETTKDNIKMGYYDTIRVLKKLDGYKYVFKVRSNAYYKFICRKVNKRLLKRIYNFFDVDNFKEAVIKSLEYIMEKEGYNYYDIYIPYKVIKKIRKSTTKKYFVYDFIRSLRKI
ncbi:MAG: patatin-like phospholipase family protein [Bacilli bacterium]|nr:patatin-like phospholipase family protein [Bacilli bacterium]